MYDRECGFLEKVDLEQIDWDLTVVRSVALGICTHSQY